MVEQKTCTFESSGFNRAKNLRYILRGYQNKTSFYDLLAAPGPDGCALGTERGATLQLQLTTAFAPQNITTNIATTAAEATIPHPNHPATLPHLASRAAHVGMPCCAAQATNKGRLQQQSAVRQTIVTNRSQR